MTWLLPVVHVHAPGYPYQRIASLVTASGVDRSYIRMEAGAAAFHISQRDPQANLDTLRMGNRILIESPTMPNWAGVISSPQESLSGGLIDMQALGLASMLDNRQTPQGEAYSSSIGSGAVYASIIRNANRYEHTGISLPSVLPMGPAVVDLATGGQSCLSALNELHDRTNYEWWLDVDAAPWGINATARWGFAQGEDYSGSVHLYEGRHFTELGYGLDFGAVKTDVSTLGGTSAIADRTASTQAARTTGGTMLADERIRRAVLAYGAPYGQRVTLDPTTTNPSELNRRTRRDHERSLTAGEQISCSVNRNADWRRLWCGNYITVHARTTLGGDLSRIVRINQVQPSEEAGVCHLTLETAIR